MRADDVREHAARIRVWPRRLLLDTPGVRATVPLLRGVWGAALHHLDPAAYTAVFSPPAGSPGYVLRPAPPDPATAPALDWLLVGVAENYEEPLRRAWDVAAGMGLGPRRRRFRVREFVALGPDGGPARPGGPWPLDAAAWPVPGDPAAAPCRLLFPAPLRLLRRGRLLDRPTLADLTVAAARRVRAYLPAEACASWDRLAREALTAAQRVRAGPWQGERLDLHRYSVRQRTELELRGVAGRLDLPAGPGPLWPLLAAAQWLHLGKGTVVGLGQLLIRPLDACT
jgi:hypothetical protein